MPWMDIKKDNCGQHLSFLVTLGRGRCGVVARCHLDARECSVDGWSQRG